MLIKKKSVSTIESLKKIINNLSFSSSLLNFISDKIQDKHSMREDSVEIINEQVPCITINVVHSIVLLCLNLIDLKKNIFLFELDVLKDFFVSNFNFEEKETELVEKIFDSLLLVEERDELDGNFIVINQFCRYEEKLLVCRLLFTIASAKKEITYDELSYILECSQKMNVLSNDFNMIRQDFFDEDINYYQILGVDFNSSVAEIKSAYRNLVLQFHPDISGNNDEYSSKKFQEILDAYSFIKKVKKFS